ncbi:MAG: diacylglycerol kinase family lipid kinase [Paludibacteraceae bacterium]|nr:diacylglycerol kinase family lipid kinase [Paludibacteraceae bacterium]
MKKVWFIVNPVSGTSDRKVWVDKAVKKLEGIYDITVVKTEYRGHGHKIASDAVKQGIDVVVAVGGDGTVNEIGSALVGSKTVLCIFPMGSGNGLARELGLSVKSADKAIETLRNGKVAEVDYGTAFDAPFFCTCGTGFDAEIARLFVTNKKRGFWQYLKLSVKTFFTFKPIDVTLTVDGNTLQRSVFLLNAANIKQFGFGAYIAPLASVQDSLLDVTIVPPVNLFSALRLTFGMFTHRLHKMKPIETFKCQSLEISLPADAPFHVDGDYIRQPSGTFTVKVNRGLKVLV